MLRCDFCGRTTDLDSPSAIERGWYSHTVTVVTVSIATPTVGGTALPDAISLGHVCPACASAVPAE